MRVGGWGGGAGAGGAGGAGGGGVGGGMLLGTLKRERFFLIFEMPQK